MLKIKTTCQHLHPEYFSVFQMSFAQHLLTGGLVVPNEETWICTYINWHRCRSHPSHVLFVCYPCLSLLVVAKHYLRGVHAFKFLRYLHVPHRKILKHCLLSICTIWIIYKTSSTIYIGVKYYISLTINTRKTISHPFFFFNPHTY